MEVFCKLYDFATAGAPKLGEEVLRRSIVESFGSLDHPQNCKVFLNQEQVGTVKKFKQEGKDLFGTVEFVPLDELRSKRDFDTILQLIESGKMPHATYEVNKYTKGTDYPTFEFDRINLSLK